MNLTPQQLGTVLAALRHWQRETEDGDYPGDLWDIAADGGAFEPLSADDIDELCENINCEPSPTPTPTGAPVRLFNEYGSAAGNEHADHIDEIADSAFDEIEAYVEEHNICPRDTIGWVWMGWSNRMSHYTIKRAIKLKKQNDAGQ